MTATPNTAALQALLMKVEAGGELPRPMPFPVWQCAHVLGAYRGSLDAAKALHEAVLPGWIWWAGNGGASVISPDDFLDHTSDPYTGHDDIAARAWLLAIIHALIAAPVAENERGV